MANFGKGGNEVVCWESMRRNHVIKAPKLRKVQVVLVDFWGGFLQKNVRNNFCEKSLGQKKQWMFLKKRIVIGSFWEGR